MKTIQQKREAKGKVQGAKARPAIGVTMGNTIADAIERELQTVTALDAIKQLIGKPLPDVLVAIETVKQRRDERKLEVQAEHCGMKDADTVNGKADVEPEVWEIVHKLHRSLDANYQRYITIMTAIKDGKATADIEASTSIIEAYGFSTDKSGKKGGNATTKKAMRASGFASWNAKTARIIEVQDGKPTPESIARLEAHTKECLALLAKYHLQTSFPVADMLAIVAKPKSGKAPKHLKAA